MTFNNIKKQFTQASDDMASRMRNRYYGSENNNRHKRHKIIDPEIGEYVTFEEIATEDSNYCETVNDSKNAKAPKAENQISDIDWEDIKI